eukprot:CAMPEP_0172933044 /NCGR_PEP_ID=MMETSP1075-20121228/220306_1 /TAXON_ID=2916 /ORGANISM="Ceratium fusus, Strain PA161109" /LENGTH=99 /DNA_ID=CAMNT_0013794381 /DNA_START=497 /DNA_END=796 /DNA_ORIENTATION=-
MKFACARLLLALPVLFAASVLGDETDGCKEQERFDIIMCKSHMCTDCVLDWCMEACQEVQTDFSTCRCADWPKKRTSYSAGDFKGKGKFGDVSDYSKDD